MTKNTVLNTSAQVSMADAAIKKLQDDIDALTAASTAFSELMDNDSISSGAVSVLKEIAYDYTIAINACISADELDIKDLRTLKDSIGDTDYDGDTILTKKDNAYDSYEENMEACDKAYDDIFENDWQRFAEKGFALGQLAYYKVRYELDHKEYQKWKEKEDDFDELNESLSTLFTESIPYRDSAKKGLEVLNNAYDGETINASYDKSWQNEIVTLQDNSIDGYISQWRSSSGKCKWEQISEFLKKDSETVTTMEYLAFAELMDGMSVDELNTLFNDYTNIDSDCVDNLYNTDGDFSSVLKKAVQVYKTVSVMEANLTMFNDDWNGTDDQKKVISEKVTKSVFLYNLVNCIDDTKRNHSVEISRDDDGVYTAKITHDVSSVLESDSSYDISAPCTITKTEKEILVANPYNKSIINSTKVAVGDTLSVLLPGANKSDDWSENWANPNIRDYAITSVANMAIEGGLGEYSIPGLAYTLAVSGANKAFDDQKKINAISATCGELDALELYDALAIQGNIVSISGTNSTMIVDPANYDDKELTLRVAAYNADVDNKGKEITVESLKKSAAKGGKKLENYMDWYNRIGMTVKIGEYSATLSDMYTDFINEHKNITGGFENLTIEQLNELIKKEKNPSYEIDASLWE